MENHLVIIFDALDLYIIDEPNYTLKYKLKQKHYSHNAALTGVQSIA